MGCRLMVLEESQTRLNTENKERKPVTEYCAPEPGYQYWPHNDGFAMVYAMMAWLDNGVNKCKFANFAWLLERD